MRKIAENILVFTAILFLVILISFVGGYFTKMTSMNGKKTLNERIMEMNQNIELTGILINLISKEKEALDNLDKYYAIYGSALQKSFCGRVRQMFFIRENFFKDCEKAFKEIQRELLNIKFRNFFMRIFSAIPADYPDNKIFFDFFSSLIKSDLQILMLMHKNASNGLLLKMTQDKNGVSEQRVKQTSLFLKRAKEMINEIKKELAKFESEKIII